MIDFKKNSEDLHIKTDIYIRILRKAIGQTTQDIINLENALPINDYEKIRGISHRLKGDYDNLRLTNLSSIAREINELAKTDNNKDKIAMLTEQFKMQFEQFKTLLNSQPHG